MNTRTNERGLRHHRRMPGRIAVLVLALSAAAAMNAAHAGKKVEICHYPPGNPGNAHTVSVAISAWTAHEAHGDTLGECPEPPESDPVDPGGSGGGGPTVANSFVVVLCDGRKGEKGRSIEVSDTGRAIVTEAECE